MNQDPVCGMTVNQPQEANKSNYHGTDYYFCSSQCKQKFDSNPAQYAHLHTSAQGGSAGQPQPAGKTSSRQGAGTGQTQPAGQQGKAGQQGASGQQQPAQQGETGGRQRRRKSA